MANLILNYEPASPGTKTASISANMQYLRVEYSPVGLSLVAGATHAISDIISSDFLLSLQYNTQAPGAKNGTIALAVSVPLLFFAHVSPLQGKVETNVEYGVYDALTGLSAVTKVTFTFPVFDGCRTFSTSDRMTVTLVGDATANVKIYSIDAPYSSPYAPAITYNTGKINGSSNYGFPACDILYIKTSKPFQLHVVGMGASAQNSIMEFPQDFDSLFALEPVTNVTPYALSNYAGLETKVLSIPQCKIFATTAEDVLYIYQKREY
jgi:hypothetical protein